MCSRLGAIVPIALLILNFDSAVGITPPSFAAPMGNQTAAIGRETVFSCSVRNIGKYQVGWLRASDQTILSIHKRTVTHNPRISVTYEVGAHGTNVTGSSTSTEESTIGTWQLHIRQLKESDKDCYMCQINTSPMISNLGCLDILVPPQIIDGSDTSTDLAVSEGDNATLSCRATGKPTPKISWKREDGESIVIKVPSSSSQGSIARRETDVYNGSVLHFYRIDRAQMGMYLCIASNNVPPTVSKRVMLAVNFAPVVKVPNQLLGAPVGTNVHLECFVEAFPNTINFWVKNDEGMILTSPKYILNEVKTKYTVQMSLVIKKFTKDDESSYKCVSTNSLGKADGTIRLYAIGMTNDLDGATRGKDHISFIGGLAEAARGAGSNRGSAILGCATLLHGVGLFSLILPAIWPRCNFYRDKCQRERGRQENEIRRLLTEKEKRQCKEEEPEDVCRACIDIDVNGSFKTMQRDFRNGENSCQKTLFAVIQKED
ncbi:lachesin-like [Orussus abietinus]|uniref:lachesin-like n=1 Tax=Orussus abietinus TaxID=222816 RepID=UPI000625965E|nr:lachesin-like [Orussus abietinus]